jgi:hypothetical protein
VGWNPTLRLAAFVLVGGTGLTLAAVAFLLDLCGFAAIFISAIQGESVMPTKGQHVVPNGGKWAVRKAGADRASGIFTTQKEAIARGKELAQNQGTELYVHGKDGRIRERSSFGKDPFPPKG